MKLEVSGSRVNVVEDETLVAGEIKVHVAEFDFGDSWDEYAVKLAVFKNDDVTVEMVIKDGTCVIPWEALASPGELYIGVHGESADKRRPTLWSEAVTVNEGTGEADASREPTPDVWQQLLAAIGDITPHVGDNGHWFVGGVDTGTPAQGERGDAYVLTDADKAEIAQMSAVIVDASLAELIGEVE